MQPSPPPVAKRVPVPRRIHSDTFIDDYGWLRDREEPDTVAYLEAENRYTAQATAHLESLRTQLFEEIRSRIQETDLSAPARRGEWFYASRTEEGAQYPVFVRMYGAPDADEAVILDLNHLAADAGAEYLGMGAFSVSPDQRLAAYSIDLDGSERFTLRVRTIEAGEDLDDILTGLHYGAAWSTDGRYLFYTTVDEAHRPHQVWRHELGGGQDDDVMVFEEPDERMYLSVGTTQDDRYLVVHAQSRSTSDVHYLDAGDPLGDFRPVLGRIEGVEYSVEHKDDRWLIVTNEQAPNGRLISIAVSDPDDRRTMVDHDDDRRVAGVIPLASHVVVFGRRDGLTSVTVLPDAPTEPGRDLSFEEPVYTVSPGRNLEYDTRVLRLTYQSLVTPARVIDVDLETDSISVVKETPVLGGFDRDDYRSERIWATAGDGNPIPISLVRRREVSGSGPLLLYGYGSYEATMDPWFSPSRLSLLDRGVTFAVAHIRGGGEMGRAWYEQGKLEQKINTFTDFVACAEHLIESGYTDSAQLAIRGGSAGGLLVGAVTNLRPELCSTVIAEVPFVDVINSMLDASLPLTVIEWEEWGNPSIEQQYEWMRSYSPYDNVHAAAYPAMLVTAGLNDPRVPYWEPAKWVARMRAISHHRGPLLLKTEMGSGHAGPSGRYDAWRDEAFVMAFLLDRWGLADSGTSEEVAVPAGNDAEA